MCPTFVVIDGETDCPTVVAVCPLKVLPMTATFDVGLWSNNNSHFVIVGSSLKLTGCKDVSSVEGMKKLNLITKPSVMKLVGKLSKSTVPIP